MTNEGFVADIIRGLPKTEHGVALDIGANFGIYTAMLAKKFGTVYAFEPLPDNFSKIRKEDNTVLWQMAVSDKDEKIKLYTVPNPGGGTTVEEACELAKWGHKYDTFVEVESTTLDSFCSGMKVDFMKMDIEGGETKALEAGIQTLKNNNMTIILETHKTADLKKLWSIFQDTGYLNISDENGNTPDHFEADIHYLIRKTKE